MSGLRYKDKVTIVTGGSKGIGEGCVRAFVAEGSKVCAKSAFSIFIMFMNKREEKNDT